MLLNACSTIGEVSGIWECLVNGVFGGHVLLVSAIILIAIAYMMYVTRIPMPLGISFGLALLVGLLPNYPTVFRALIIIIIIFVGLLIVRGFAKSES